MTVWGRGLNKTHNGSEAVDLYRYTWHVVDSKGRANCNSRVALIDRREEPPAPDDENRICVNCKIRYAAKGNET